MPIDRRKFVVIAGASVLAAPAVGSSAAARPIKAIAFDGFVITDARPVFAKVEEFFPGKGRALSEAWRTRLFEYTWLRTAAGRYVDFGQVALDSLLYAGRASSIELNADQRLELMRTWLILKAWPDVAAALKQFKAAGIRMAFLANLTDTMMDAVVANSGLEGLLEPHLSTDRVKAFKPDPRAYQMGLDAFRLTREEIAYAAFAGWDAVGAYPTFWVNRMSAPPEELGGVPDGVGPGMGDLVTFVLG